MSMLCIGDTDSLKLKEGFDISVIENYNKNVIKKLKKVSNDLHIDFERFKPKDKDGISHLIGIFEEDGKYKSMISQGAKKYAYIKNVDNKKIDKYKNANIIKKYKDSFDILEITVSGVPKKGAKCLKSLSDFKDNFIFRSEITGKNTLLYIDNMKKINLVDYQGNSEILDNKYGCVLLPATYTLDKSIEYADLLNTSSDRAIYKEGEENEKIL